jgi:putative FmdB family regulatory protein
MPIYEYRCSQCDTTFSRLQAIGQSDGKLACPECGGEARRILSTFCSSTPSSSAAASSSSCGSSGFS